MDVRVNSGDDVRMRGFVRRHTVDAALAWLDAQLLPLGDAERNEPMRLFSERATKQERSAFCNRRSVTKVRTLKSVRASPTRHSSRQSRTSTPPINNAFPSTWMVNCEKKLASVVTSLSMRSIYSPGVCVL